MPSSGCLYINLQSIDPGLAGRCLVAAERAAREAEERRAAQEAEEERLRKEQEAQEEVRKLHRQ